MRDLNLRPRHYQWRALTSWASRPQFVGCFNIINSWWALRGSNPRPSRCKRDALANWAKRPHFMRVFWWATRDSNLRPRHYQWRALTSWASRPQFVGCFNIINSWWALRGSNPRPSRCKRDALANWAKRPHSEFWWSVTDRSLLHPIIYTKWQLVERRGLEPRTPCLQSRCSSQLS